MTPISPPAGSPSRRRLVSSLATVVALVSLAACFNIYVQFPTAELSRVATDYAREAYGTVPAPAPVEGDETEEPAEKPEGGESGFLSFNVFPVLHAAEGGDIDVKIDSPAIRAIKDQQTARLKLLRPHFEAGRVGTASNGDIVVRNEDGIDLKAKKELREWVAAENKSREELYKEVARANKIEPSRIEEIRKIWAAAWIEQAPPGYWVQVDGKWTQKPPKR